jgi:hypothetical protein
MKAAFQLSKWYLDCVADSGDTSIVYTGAVAWGPVGLHYSSLLQSKSEVISVSQSLRPQNEPTLDDGMLRWESRALKLEGEWQRDAPALHETVFASACGCVAWRCLMPRAKARIRDLIGLGYAEHLTMSIAPWELSIRILRWGRFLTPSAWIVWIDWLGDHTRRIVYRDGQIAAVVLIDDDVIVFRDGTRLTMDRDLVLRSGALGSTALSVIPGVRDTFPARLLQVNERKWRSRGRLEGPGIPTTEGWAIHERVEWPA